MRKQKGSDLIRGPLQRLTTAAIKEDLTYQLSSKLTIRINIDKFTGLAYLELNHKYYDRAEFVLYRINIWNPSTPPVFIINISDLTKSLLYELEQIKLHSPEEFDRAVTEAIQTLMEGINERYYHVSGIAYKITWRFDS